MGSSAAELVESKHNSEKIIGKSMYLIYLMGFQQAKWTSKSDFTLSQDMHLQETFTGMQMSRVGVGILFPSGLEHLPFQASASAF